MGQLGRLLCALLGSSSLEPQREAERAHEQRQRALVRVRVRLRARTRVRARAHARLRSHLLARELLHRLAALRESLEKPQAVEQRGGLVRARARVGVGARVRGRVRGRVRV